jgi:hypothetical protein
VCSPRHRAARFLLLTTAPLLAQDRNYVTALGGFAAISDDGKNDFNHGAIASSYRHSNGAALNVGAGRHFSNWISVQGNYIWNRNTIFLSGINNGGFYEHRNDTSQHAVVLDGLLYFRPLTSRVRPYLSTGVGLVRISRELREVTALRPPILETTPSASAWYAGLRVAVGIDVLWKNGWGLRYSFSETISPNLFSKSLLPPGDRTLMNFQNLWGVVKYF